MTKTKHSPLCPASAGYTDCHCHNTMTTEQRIEECVFCDRSKIASKVLYDYADVIVFEPLNPVCEGHMLVVPTTHIDNFTDDAHTTGHVMEVAALVAGLHGGAYNLITSKGKEATQSVMHLHVHLVPRKNRDGLCLPWDTLTLRREWLEDRVKKMEGMLKDCIDESDQTLWGTEYKLNDQRMTYVHNRALQTLIDEDRKELEELSKIV